MRTEGLTFFWKRFSMQISLILLSVRKSKLKFEQIIEVCVYFIIASPKFLPKQLPSNYAAVVIFLIAKEITTSRKVDTTPL